MINRDQFIVEMDKLMRRPDLPVEAQCHNDDHPLWAGEHSYTPRITCQWFVCVQPLDLLNTAEGKDGYWKWINTNLAGKMVCYCSDDINKQEWWGFTHEDDAVLWLLRWGNRG